jgi:hypothetical protein
MAKPILIIKLPYEFHMNCESFEEIVKSIESRTGQEYHVLPVIEKERTELDFQVFYEKDFTEVNYEELKEIIKESIK